MATVRNLSIATLGATLVALGLGGAAQAITLTFDELPTQPVDDLSFQGVTFDFKEAFFGRSSDSTHATYNASIQNPTTFVQSPVLTGHVTNPSTLTLDFAAPTSILSFDVAREFRPVGPPDRVTGYPITYGGYPYGYTIELFDPTLTSLGRNFRYLSQTNVNREINYGIQEGQFTYNGNSVSRAVLTFYPAADYDRLYGGADFMIDNLTYEPVPEPLTILGSGMALGFGVLMERQYSRKRKKAKQTY